MPTDIGEFKLRRPAGPELRELIIWLLSYAICSLLPFYGSFFIIYGFTTAKQGLYDYTQKGEFALLAASLLGSLAFLLSRDAPPFRFPLRWILTPAMVFFAMLCALLFAGGLLVAASPEAAVGTADVVPERQGPPTFLSPSPLFITTWSIVVYVVTLVLVIIAMLIDQQLKTVPIYSMEEQRRARSLSEKYRALEDDE